MSEATAHAALGTPCEPVIAGTLCLMSCYVQNPVALYAERIASNLAQMANLSNLSPEMRAVCRRLAERWDGILNESRQRAQDGAKVIDRRAVH